MRVRRGETQPYLARRHPHRHGHLQDPAPDRAALGPRQRSARQPVAAHDQQQRAGEHRKVHPQLVRPHRRRRCAVREQIQLLLLDPVLHLAAGAVQFLVQLPARHFLPAQAGDHEARVRAALAWQPLRLAHHSPLPAPVLQRAVAEIPETPRRLAGPRAGLARLLQLPANLAQQTTVPRQAQHIVHSPLLAPGHERVPAKTGVPAHHDRCLRPALPDAPHDPLQFRDRPLRCLRLRRPQARTQHMLSARDVQRQVAIVAVIAVIEATLLLAVQLIVGGIHVQHDPLRERLVHVQEQIHQQVVDLFRARHDLLVAVLVCLQQRTQLQPVERARASQRMAPIALPPAALPGQARSGPSSASASKLSSRSRS